MDAPIRDEVFHRDAADFAADFTGSVAVTEGNLVVGKAVKATGAEDFASVMGKTVEEAGNFALEIPAHEGSGHTVFQGFDIAAKPGIQNLLAGSAVAQVVQAAVTHHCIKIHPGSCVHLCRLQGPCQRVLCIQRNPAVKWRGGHPALIPEAGKGVGDNVFCRMAVT